MHETMKTIEQIKVAEETLLGWLMGEVGEGKEAYACHIEENGKLIDQIKDLSETAKDCMKKKYYEMLICDMMREDDDMNDVGRAGYDNWRYKSSGRFAPKGHGSDVGHGSRLHMGYTMDDPHMHPGSKTMRGDYDDYSLDEHMDRKSPLYHQYKSAKMGYTKTHSETDHRKMDNHITEATMETMSDMREMWDDASPETRARMKSNLTTLLKEWEKG